MSNTLVREQIPYDLNFVNLTDSIEPIPASDIFSNKNVVIFGLPGAFTPTCSTKQLPGFDELHSQFQECGIDDIYCTSVNDGFVMQAWFAVQEVNKVKPLSDGNGKFARFMGMLVSKENLGFGKRSWRYAAVIRNGRVVQMFEEAGIRDEMDSDPYEVSTPENVLEWCKSNPQEAIPVPEVELSDDAPEPPQPDHSVLQEDDGEVN